MERSVLTPLKSPEEARIVIDESEIVMNQNAEKIVFISARMQPPHRGHISFIKQLLKWETDENLNYVILGLGVAPIDNLSSTDCCFERLNNKVSLEELDSIFRNLNLTGSELNQTIRNFDDESLSQNIQTRIEGFRKFALKPWSQSMFERVAKNPFTFGHRETMIRLQMSETENNFLSIVSIAGNQTADRMIEKSGLNIKNAERIYIASGDEYISRATHRYIPGQLEAISNADWKFASKFGYDKVLTFPRTECETLSGTKIRALLNQMKTNTDLENVETLMNMLIENDEPGIRQNLIQTIFSGKEIKNPNIDDLSALNGLIPFLKTLDNFQNLKLKASSISS